MKSSTSWLCTSRKYSAIVSADSATRRRVPGGSSIWPKTRAVWPMTPASSISTIRSLPSRVRSPTPANTDTPPWSLATRAIISWMSTVLPTPAPPNRPILPPWTYGVSRSMTLMPVSNIWVLDSSWSKAGALRWMPQRSLTSSFSSLLEVEALAEGVEHAAQGHVADGDRDRAAGVASPGRRGRGRRSAAARSRGPCRRRCAGRPRGRGSASRRRARARPRACCRSRASSPRGTRCRRPGR